MKHLKLPHSTPTASVKGFLPPHFGVQNAGNTKTVFTLGYRGWRKILLGVLSSNRISANGCLRGVRRAVQLEGTVRDWRNCNGSDCMKLWINNLGQWVGGT